MPRLYIVLFFVITNFCASAQELSGIVRSSLGEPLVEAYIYNPKGSIHSHTDANGYFIINGFKAGDTLQVSYLGFEKFKMEVVPEDFNNELSIVLKDQPFNLDQIFINNSLKQAYQVANIDLKVNPVNSSQEILRKVPGLFIGQHAGGGKAEQIFLRGFDIDHGTDIALSVDGIPVNMVSHAHGQGYSDLHFIIPETIDAINFGKGPYYSESGNFTTAGYVKFKTKDRLETSKVGYERGSYNFSRLYTALDLMNDSENQDAYIASEYIQSDGPFESPQNFKRFNIMGKYFAKIGAKDRLTVLASSFTSGWDASRQIPQRLVDAGTITRFGAVDDTEGGQTSRTNVAINHTKVIDDKTFVTSSAYYSNYKFQLFSNFTFFLEDSIAGDQIMQQEFRNIYGFESVLHKSFNLGIFDVEAKIGTGMRYDDVDDNELSFTTNRKKIREQLAFGNVDETNIHGFANFELHKGNWTINPGLRVDNFSFNYVDNTQETYERNTASKTFLSPKLNIIYNPNSKIQLFAKSGIGFHSNDSRVAVKGDLATLPAAYGLDLGTVYKPTNKLLLNAALWYLQLEQEFVYEGDAAIVEPSGRTRRLGVEFGARYQLMDNLFFDTDFSYSKARSLDDAEGENFIPLAPDLTAAGGLAYMSNSNFSTAIRYRWIKDRPANEDNSIVATGYFIVDANISYRINNVTLGVSVENLLDTEWNEAQFATESRLRDEISSVEELHFTPGTPLFLKAKIAYEF